MSDDDQPDEPAFPSVALEEKRKGDKTSQQNGRVQEDALVGTEKKAIQPYPERGRESFSFSEPPPAVQRITEPGVIVKADEEADDGQGCQEKDEVFPPLSPVFPQAVRDA
jgi:hypothetical protein